MLSAHMLAQTLGIIGAQGLLALGDAGNAALFIGVSILVSISFAPILLSVQPASSQSPDRAPAWPPVSGTGKSLSRAIHVMTERTVLDGEDR